MRVSELRQMTQMSNSNCQVYVSQHTYIYINMCIYKICVNYINIAIYLRYCRILHPWLLQRFILLNAKRACFPKTCQQSISLFISLVFSNFCLTRSTLIFCITYPYLLIHISSLDTGNTFQCHLKKNLHIESI